MASTVVVLGAGAVGLSTAVCIQELLPDVSVTILADRFNQDTTSDGAAGLFRPTMEDVPGVPLDIFRQWCQTSFDHYMTIAMSSEAAEAGISRLSGYHFYSDPSLYTQKPVLEDILPQWRECTDKELSHFPGVPMKKGYFFSTLIIECRWYLPWLMKRFKRNGGTVESRNISSFTELHGRFDIVVNCTGLGSRSLANDKELIPVRGQLLKVKAPWIKQLLYINKATVIIPGREFVSVGSTKHVGNECLDCRQSDTKDILKRTTEYVPSLKDAELLYTWVGLRPYRSGGPRLQHETVKFNDKYINVIHNYGHGSHGVGLSWGTAVHAAKLVEKVLRNTSYKRTSKL